MRLFPKIAAAALILIALPAGAAPVSWKASPEAGRIGFIANWNGMLVKGRFKQFSVKAKFDPAQPAGGSIEVTIATASLATQSADIARTIRGPAWFDVKDYPKASFVSSAIAKQADGSFLLTGKLSLKGHEKELSFPIKIGSRGQNLELSGQLKLDRGDFAIGSGRWAHGNIIARTVKVTFSVLLARGG